MHGKYVLYEVQDNVATIALNRPEAMNALSSNLSAEFISAVEAAMSDDEVRVIVLTGKGRAFCAGGDVKAFTQQITVAERHDGMLKLARLVLKLAESPKPVISAVNGDAIGAGLGIALAADLVVSAESARFSVPFLRIGLVGDAGLNYLLPRQVGLARAKQMMFTGEMLSAEEALKIGLVSKVLPDSELAEYVYKTAAEFAGKPPRAYAAMKRLLNNSLNMTLPEALDCEASTQTVLFNTEDRMEGVAAFLEKRRPRFTGK
ncbi:MAG: enoyl-CoA hydratase [Dethiobacter sp.]|jgi:2-(1,2-epoxy-1,2-dihydrophenyl)acetyl-CoA isomerase|nr:enoyl-CoA hydratase [Dethiobacter sp.]